METKMKIGKALALAGLMSASSLPALAQDWAGSWGGVSLGYGKGTYQQGVSALSQVGPDVDVNDVILGLRYSRNMQSNANVYGFDAEFSNGVDGITAQGTTSPFWSCITGACNVDIKTLLTVRGRYGWLTSPEMLVYGAGGLAIGRVEGGIFNSAQQGDSHTQVGYTVGVGAERMIGASTTIFGEVNYVDLGDLEFGQGVAATDVYDGVGDFATVKLGVNFKF
jgi:outer membrane immunogenic protein